MPEIVANQLPGAPRSQEIEPLLGGAEAAYLRGLVRGLRCGFLAIDRAGRLVLVNEPARRILELGGDPGLGQAVERALAPHPQLARVLRDSFVMSNLPNRAEIDLQCRSERGKTIGFTLSLVHDDRGRPVGTAMFFKDLTQVEQREEQERLRDRLAALGQMAARMAHEIRNPLASIGVSCSLMRRRPDLDEEARGMLRKIDSEIGRLNATIGSSLEFVRPLTLKLERQPLIPVLDAALRTARERFPETGVSVERRYDDNLQPLRIDREQLRGVFENLFVNAFEAMQGGGTLCVETRAIPGPEAASVPYHADGECDASPTPEWYVEVRVRDTGPGISEENRAKLFYPFFTTKPQGSGVGLAMAKKIIDNHEGLLDVVCGDERGTTFTVRLPYDNEGHTTS